MTDSNVILNNIKSYNNVSKVGPMRFVFGKKMFLISNELNYYFTTANNYTN